MARLSEGAPYGKVENDGNADWREAYALFSPATVAYWWWHAGRRTRDVIGTP